MYFWNVSSFTEELLLPTQGACDFKAFTINSTLYLAVANEYNGSTYDIDSLIYKPEWK